MCLVLHVSLSSACSSVKAVVEDSEGTQRSTLPSSPAEASISPVAILKYGPDEPADRLTFGTKANDIDWLCVSGEGGEVCDFSFVALSFDAP